MDLDLLTAEVKSELEQREFCSHSCKHFGSSLEQGLNLDTLIKGFSDSSYADSLSDRKSTSGYCFMLGNGVVSWASKKQNTVALSTTEAEYIGMTHACTEALWYRQLLKELGLSADNPIKLFGDNQGAIRLTKNPQYHNRTKHIDTKYHFIREHVAANEVDVEYLQTAKMPADVLTKSLQRNNFDKCTRMLNIVPSSRIENTSVRVDVVDN